MIRKNFKGRCRKWKLEKCKDVMRAYSAIQAAYAERLAVDDGVKEFRCNVEMTGLEEGEYTSDFVSKILFIISFRYLIRNKFY